MLVVQFHNCVANKGTVAQLELVERRMLDKDVRVHISAKLQLEPSASSLVHILSRSDWYA